MKIRNGFVSNSSSSSFIVTAKRFKTTRDVAMAMVPSREWDGDGLLMEKLGTMKDFDKPIAFRTCNYDTFISKEGDDYYIFTCHNHEFEAIQDSRKYPVAEEDMWEVEHRIKYSNFYYWPEYNVEAMPTSYDQLDKKGIKGYCDCFMDLMWDRKGNIFCPKCGKIAWSKEAKKEN